MIPLLLFLLTPLLGDPLNLDLPDLWDPDCMGCIPRAMCPEILKDELIFVDLNNPMYADEVLSTEEGGVITAKDLRVQAKKVHYLKNETQCTVYCEGNLILDFREWILTGDALFYDFVTKTGYLLKGRTAAPPWYIGSKRMDLFADGEVMAIGGYLTTSEGPCADVKLHTPCIRMTKDKIVRAKDITVSVKRVPLAYLPALKLDMKEFHEMPFAVKVGWGGFMASHLSILYHFLDWKDLQGYARVDGFFKYGVGAGIDTRFNPKHRPIEFNTRNYWAHDIPISTPQRRNRWRYQGNYADKLYNGQVSIKACYDVVSDPQMASQYNIRDFDLKTAGKTQLEIKRQTPAWIANLFTRVRVNDFQSINQELPSFKFNWHPFEIPKTGIMFSGDLEAAYLHYMFSKNVNPQTNFNAGRVYMRPVLYRPFNYGPFIFTPQIGGYGIYYSDNQNDRSVGQAELTAGCKFESNAYHRGSKFTHAISPYIDYQFLATPRVPNDRHFIFNIQDGLGKVNRFRFGTRNSLFFKTKTCYQRPIWFDIWGNLFIKDGIAFPDQRAFLQAEYHPFQNIAFNFFGGWDFTANHIERCNPRVDITVNENLALALEYRYRSEYAWRKADFYNFVLENVRTQSELLNSPLSDRRETLLLRTFMRFHPDLGITFDYRHGWDRVNQPKYTEYSATLDSMIFEHWRFNFIFEKRESDVRYSMSLRLDPGPPPMGKVCPKF